MAIITVLRPENYHYDLHTKPGVYLMNGLNPYGVDLFGTCPACIFGYSPLCALFFHFFSLFPAKLGLSLFLLVSLATLGWGYKILSRALRECGLLNLTTSPYRHLFWIVVGVPLLDSVLWAKIEIFELGVMMASVGYIMLKKNRALASAILGAISTWKFQPLPIAALIFLVLFVLERDLRSPIYFIAGVVAALLAPIVVLPPELFLEVYRSWYQSIQEIVRTNWDTGNQHFYTFLNGAMGMTFSLETFNQIALAIGFSMAAFLFSWLRSRKERYSDLLRAEALMLAFGLGSAFLALCSPMSQSNAYILYLPLVLTFLIFVTQQEIPSRVVNTILLVALWVISLTRTDLTPKPLRLYLAKVGIKPLGLFLFLLIVLWFSSRSRKQTTPICMNAP